MQHTMLNAKLHRKSVGHRIIYHQQLDSTNLAARRLVDEGTEAGTVVLANEQKKGRGRRGRNWHSPPGSGLWFSTIFRPNFAPVRAPLMTIMASLAVAKSLEEMRLDPVIKWPNDILLNNKKVCGILSELVSSKDRIKAVIVGIGINVNQTGFPSRLANKATSIRIETGKKAIRGLLLSSIFQQLEVLYSQVTEAREQVFEAWKGRLNIIGKRIEIDSGQKKYRGQVNDLTETGALIIETAAGEEKVFRSGDTSIIDIL